MDQNQTFEQLFSDLGSVRDDMAGRLDAADAADPARLAKRRVSDAEARLAALHHERKRVDADIAAAERELSDAQRIQGGGPSTGRAARTGTAKTKPK